MLPLGGRPLVFRVMSAFDSFPVDKKILACPEDCITAFSPLAEEAGFSIVSGPRDDVLARYCIVLRHSGADRLVRATADNPFVFFDAASSLMEEAESLRADYAGYSSLPLGAGVEAVSAEALFQAEREAKDSYEREHVCPYLYNHPELFRLHRPTAPQKWQGSDIRITVDTLEDYRQAEILYDYLLSLPSDERNLGETIITAHRKLLADKKLPGSEK